MNKHDIVKYDNNMKAIDEFQKILDVVLEQSLILHEELAREFAELPAGTLVLNRPAARPDRHYFIRKLNGHNVGITRDRELVYSLARKKYLSIIVPEINACCSSLSQLKKTVLNKRRKHRQRDCSAVIRDLLKSYGEAGLDVSRITMSQFQHQWMHAGYASSNFHEDELIYGTFSGIKMRSKSEQAIGNRLEMYGIPYRYEECISVNASRMDDENGFALSEFQTYYPDFTILTGCGDIILWEHLGRTDLFDYRSHNMEKICAYREAYGIDSRHLILTFERDLRNLEELDRIITTQILMVA